MIEPGSIAAGVAVGMAVEQSNKFVRQLTEELSTDDFFGLFKEQRDLLLLIARRSSNQLTPPQNDAISLQPYPVQYQVPEHNRPHLCLFISTGLSGESGNYTPARSGCRLHLEIPGAGVHIRTIKPGWTQLDLPAGTMIATADGTTHAGLISMRDDPLNDVVDNPLMPLSLYNDNPTSTGIDTDVTVKFGGNGTEWATMVLISNNSGADILYEFSQATTSGSDVLADGQKIIVENILTQGIHLQAAADTPINAASGIVVRAWA